MNEKLAKINQAIALLREVIPADRRFDLDNVRVETKPGNYPQKPHIYLFDCETYEEGTEFLRSLGCQRRDKSPQSDGRTSLTSDLENVTITVYCGTLPKTCRIVETKKLVPKREVRTIESNEMVEVTIKEVVCSGGNEDAKLETLEEGGAQ